MKCLTNKHIQELIDGEMSDVQMAESRKHLSTCSECSRNYNEQLTLTQSVKIIFNSRIKLPEKIPEFNVPIQTTKRKVIRIPLWVKVAAMLIPVFIVWKMANKPQEYFKPTVENIQMYDMCNYVDANTAFQENMIITTVTDENGKVLECTSN